MNCLAAMYMFKYPIAINVILKVEGGMPSLPPPREQAYDLGNTFPWNFYCWNLPKGLLISFREWEALPFEGNSPVMSDFWVMNISHVLGVILWVQNLN